jgi:hypothetical protein
MPGHYRHHRFLVAAFVVHLTVVPDAHAWGDKGHRIVGGIAQHHLNENAQREIETLLGRGMKLQYMATWADSERALRPETGSWHYVNLPPDADDYDRQRDCADGKCAVEIISHFVDVLKDENASKRERGEALMYLVHFVGDLHQPLHCGHSEDRGGNDIELDFFGEKINLHAVWDTAIIERQGVSTEQYVQDLIDDIAKQDVRALQKGTPADWAVESRKLARRHAYRTLKGEPIRTGDRVGRAYMLSNTLVIDGRLTLAGVRLAGVLNTIWP